MKKTINIGTKRVLVEFLTLNIVKNVKKHLVKTKIIFDYTPIDCFCSFPVNSRFIQHFWDKGIRIEICSRRSSKERTK
jgi:hypothetical protein